MNSYLAGIDALGDVNDPMASMAAAAVKAAQEAAAKSTAATSAPVATVVPSTTNSFVATTNPFEESRRKQQHAASRQRELSAMNKLLIGGLVGGIVGGGVGAWLWGAHRFLGFILGSMFIGAPVGYTAGLLLAEKDLK